MYSETDSRFSLKSLIIKIFLIILIIILLIWLVPKFLSYKKSPKRSNNKTKEVVSVSKISDSSLKKLESAGLKYFNKDNVPKDEYKSVMVTLKDLKKDGYITDIKNDGNVCDVDKSYVKLTKNKEDYTMKSYLICGKSKDYLLTNVGEYSYCSDNLLCKKDDTKTTTTPGDDNNNNNNNSNNNSNGNNNNNNTLSEFGPWSEFVRTSCDTKAVTCNSNDSNCLQEVKLYSRKEIVGKKTITNKFDHTALKSAGSKNVYACPSYNYIVINDTIYRTKGNYGEVLELNKKSTNSWTYVGQVSSETAPRFGGNQYYKYVGTQGKIHYYDYYKYNYSTEQVTAFVSGCSSTKSTTVNYYTVYKQQETYTTQEDVYATACYKSVRTRVSK